MFIFSCCRVLKWLSMVESILHFPSTLEPVPMLQASVIRHYLAGPMTCSDITGHAIMDGKLLHYHQSLHHNICSSYKLHLWVVYCIYCIFCPRIKVFLKILIQVLLFSDKAVNFMYIWPFYSVRFLVLHMDKWWSCKTESLADFVV